MGQHPYLGLEDWFTVIEWREGPCIYRSPKALNELLTEIIHMVSRYD